MPFAFDHVPPDVLLEDAPLVRVLCQVRFSATPELVDDESERVLARLLAPYLPVRGMVQGMVLPLPGFPDGAGKLEHMRTFEDAEGHWKASVAPDFIALETSRYRRRDDFLDMVRPVLEALTEVATPPRVNRVGMRYTDRIEDPQGLSDLANPALLGILPELADSDVMENQVLQTLLVDSATSSKVQVRSLFLPPGTGFDPSITPVPQRSWVLDIDAFTEQPRGWDADVLLDVIESLAKRAYQVFHWAATDEFRARFKGGEQVDG